MRLPSLNALRAFEAAARHESFARAADELCVSEGAVSRHVKLLEEDLGVALFTRLRRGLALTEPGRKFLPVLTGAFESIAAGTRQAMNDSRPLKVICPPTFSVRCLVPVLQDFRTRYPEVDLKLTTAPFTPEIFFGGEFDLGFDCGEPHRPEGVEATLILQSVMTPVCAPRLLRQTAPPAGPADLARFNLLHTTADRHDWSAWLAAFDAGNLDTSRGDVFPSADSAYRAAVHGQGVVIGDLSVLVEELASDALVCLFDDMALAVPTEAYHVFGRPDRWDDPRARKFRDWLEETFR
jgi:LysR family glycine cleavage system transcriptional activator